MKKKKEESVKLVVNIDMNFFRDVFSFLFIIVFVLILAFVFIGMPTLYLDHENDVQECKQVYVNEPQLTVMSCFANDDWWKVNFGNNINCTCYYYDKSGQIKNQKFKVFEG